MVKNAVTWDTGSLHLSAERYLALCQHCPTCHGYSSSNWRQWIEWLRYNKADDGFISYITTQVCTCNIKRYMEGPIPMYM